jgi:hypothetical protein
MTIKRYRGDTGADRVLISVNGEVADLTGSTVVMTLSTQNNPIDSSTQVYQLTGTWDDPTSGIVEFSPSTIQADNVGYFYYDIQLTNQAGVVFTVDKGSYQFIQDITKN